MALLNNAPQPRICEGHVLCLWIELDESFPTTPRLPQTDTWVRSTAFEKFGCGQAVRVRDKMSYMDAQNLGVVPLESYSQVLLNLLVLKLRTRLFGPQPGGCLIWAQARECLPPALSCFQ